MNEVSGNGYARVDNPVTFKADGSRWGRHSFAALYGPPKLKTKRRTMPKKKRRRKKEELKITQIIGFFNL
jgi:hypothetical protein